VTVTRVGLFVRHSSPAMRIATTSGKSTIEPRPRPHRVPRPRAATCAMIPSTARSRVRAAFRLLTWKSGARTQIGRRHTNENGARSDLEGYCLRRV